MRFHESVHGVYFDDLDLFQVLHNSRYLLLIERTIGAFWDRMGFSPSLEATHETDRFQLVRANHIEYVRPVNGLGEVRVRIWVEQLGRTSLTFGFRILPMDEDVDYALGTRVLVKVDPKTRLPSPWTDAFRQKLAAYVRETAPAKAPATPAAR
jgi:acyl-CoA thioester hydrolase